jgi:hypothetical protein
MGKIVAIFESSELTQQQYDNILSEMGEVEKAQHPNRPVHISFQKGNSFCVIDVWNSPETLEEFGRNVLGPIFGKLGIAPPPPQVYPIHRYINSAEE